MKLLFDANLSRRLAVTLAEVYPGSIHASLLGADPDDEAIWLHAETGDFVIVSKDSDFYRMSVALGAPPKVVWLRIGNGPTRFVETLLKSRATEIGEFYLDPDADLLIIEN